MAEFCANDDEILVEEIQKYPSIFDDEDQNYKNVMIKENAWKKISFSVGKNIEDCKKRWRNIKDTYFRNKKKRKLGTGSALSEKPIKWALYDRLSFLDMVKHERESKNTLAEEQEETTVYSSQEDLEVDEAEETLVSSPRERYYGIIDPTESSLDDYDLHSTSTTSTSRRTSGTVKLNKRLDKNQESLTSGSRSSSPFQRNMKKFQPKVSKQNTMAQFEERSQKRMELLESIQKKNKPELEDEVDLFMKSISLTVKKFPPAELHEVKLSILKIVGDIQLKLAAPRLPQQTATHSLQSTSPDGSNSQFYGNLQYQQNEPFHLTATASHTTGSTSQYQQNKPNLTATESSTTAGLYFKNYNPENQNSSFTVASGLDSEQNELQYEQLD